MRLVGALGSAESMDAAEGADGLVALNSLLDSWSTLRLAIYTQDEANYTWPTTTRTRTIGSGGDFDTTRPIRIEKAFQRLNDVDYPIEVLDVQDYNQILSKSVNSNIISSLYYDADYPLGTIHVYPVPNVAVTLYLVTWEPLQQFSGLSVELAMPPGYERAIVYNLAVEIAPEYGKEAPQTVQRIARSSKKGIKSQNYARTRVESDVTRMNNGGFDYHIGESQ